jgi:hypothetical protein
VSMTWKAVFGCPYYTGTGAHGAAGGEGYGGAGVGPATATLATLAKRNARCAMLKAHLAVGPVGHCPP